jgi:hypothetical protein
VAFVSPHTSGCTAQRSQPAGARCFPASKGGLWLWLPAADVCCAWQEARPCTGWLSRPGSHTASQGGARPSLKQVE